ncbi:MAG: hypothetical protein BWY64_03976 [bacterium ADurb.Bin363]|nr:MAG: hypothetical protein BWY64_03976 [bacterium ADurb.Bin363]
MVIRAMDKYEEIKYAVTEMNIVWDDRILDYLTPIDLISENPDDIAELLSCYKF